MAVTNEKVVELIQMADVALTKSAQLEEKQAAEQEKIAALIPGVVKALVDGQRIDRKDEDAVARALQNPVQALQLLGKVAKHRNADEVSRLGKPTDEKQASDNSNYVKNRPISDSPAGRQLFNAVMGNRV